MTEPTERDRERECAYCGAPIVLQGEQWVDEYEDPQCPRNTLTNLGWHEPRPSSSIERRRDYLG